MKRFTLVVLAFVLQFSADAQENLLPGDLFLQQEYSNTCTLSSSAMMIRSCLYQGRSDCWTEVTEHDLRGSAWISDGLCWEWDYEIGENAVSVEHRSVSGLDDEELAAILQVHPEGIVLYCGGNVHHAVFVYDYTDGIVYCADPAKGFSGCGIHLSESLLGQRVGTQEEILRSVSAYWYISHSEIKPDVEIVTEPPVIVLKQP